MATDPQKRLGNEGSDQAASHRRDKKAASRLHRHCLTRNSSQGRLFRRPRARHIFICPVSPITLKIISSRLTQIPSTLPRLPWGHHRSWPAYMHLRAQRHILLGIAGQINISHGYRRGCKLPFQNMQLEARAEHSMAISVRAQAGEILLLILEGFRMSPTPRG